ncbi:MAG: AI-2E family transporter [Candidatus Gastranaerophilaceae bacterium]
MFSNLFQKYITVKNIIFFVVAIIFIVFMIKIQDIALMFFASYVVACSLNPLVDKIPEKINRNVASALVLCGAIVFVALFFVPMFVIAGHEIAGLANSFPQYVENLKTYIDHVPFINTSATAQLDIGSVLSSATGATTQVFGDVINVGKNIGSGVVYLITSVMLIYYFMVDNKKLKQSWLKLFPSDMRNKANSVMDTIAEKVGGYVIAQVATMASVGLIMTFGLLLLKVDYALLLGLITAVLDIIPVVGPALALIIALVVCYKSGPLILGMVVLVFSIAQLSENTFVRPFVFGKFLDLHPVVIYLFLFIAAKYMGVVGVIFAPAIAATVTVLVDELYVKNLD